MAGKKGANANSINGQWKGDKVGMTALHNWVKRRLPKPFGCQSCRLIKRLDLANKSDKYLRDMTDWEWLCRKCHMTKDGRLALAIGRMKSKRLADRNCKWCKKVFHPSKSDIFNCSASHGQLSRFNEGMVA